MTATELEELFVFYRKINPGSPDWYRAIDQVVSVLLELEMRRAQQAEKRE